ncbi:sushi, von Willebrand factor type A, EGF and pentraxin domain-containing protein 1-like isoform X1 [Gigantopelta aegis]|uniref:sushi, von Willebrand factor type A, EGF and pentraxin domain-containing protein 1-like isoform X1 n=1 Tax=Gigantopelta aegis TaxID=1735272 RepID=UPI001B88CE70|nr:sushi, von Willebrand factor type A, EGF and pentraxin domain-containing protein 1-like isoform X1 [Gigantopelta aegis]
MFVNILYCNFGRNYGQYLLFQLFVIATVSDLVKSSSCKEDITYIRDDAFFNSRLTEGKIRTHIGVENQAKCAVKCNRDSNCISFFYKKNSGTCQINSVIYLSTSGSVADEGFVYFRENMECPVPPSIPNSRPQFDVNSAPNTIGTVLEYTCSVGYTPERSVNCQVDGTWTRMACTEDCPSPPDIPNGNQLFVASTASRSQGTSLQYTCKTGFVPDNDLTTITCQVSATWTNIVCKRPDCPIPPVIANSNEQFVRSTVSTVYGATLQYECKSGFVAENGVTAVTCGVDATWTSIICKRPDCPSPPNIANSNEQFVRSAVSTVYGTTLKYQCKSGFVAENGVTTITCGVGATWTSLVCKRPDCPSPPVIANSNEQFVRSTASTVYGATLQYQCKSGFVAENGITTVTCRLGASWTSIVCKRPDCPSPPNIANSNEQFVRSAVSTVYGTTLQYQCKSGFVAENGITTVTCGLGASWTSIVCKLIRSCSEVKACNSQYGDGEYWIYPAPYGTTKAKIYCRNMNSGAIEYVTLNTVNVAYKPPNPTGLVEERYPQANQKVVGRLATIKFESTFRQWKSTEQTEHLQLQFSAYQAITVMQKIVTHYMKITSERHVDQKEHLILTRLELG